MKSRFIPELITYTGVQLRSHWIYEKTGLLGEAIVAFRGPARVEDEHLVDLVDRKEGAFIYSSDMLHFIVEHFDLDLEKAILRQRLLVGIIKDELLRRAGVSIQQQGNDLYDEDKKLSVSIATLSPVSSLIHTGVNISSKGTPVKTKGLADYGLSPEPFGQAVIEKYTEEIEEIIVAKCKVKGVR